jgi:hypothetical protein
MVELMTFRFLVTLDKAAVHSDSPAEKKAYLSNIHYAVRRWAEPLGMSVSTTVVTGLPDDPPDPPRNCGTCRFGNEISKAPDQTPIRCQRHPPLETVQNEMNQALTWIGWPQLAPTDWCGEFQPKRQSDAH